jgi:TetR/AcrR family transcriptional regulator
MVHILLDNRLLILYLPLGRIGKGASVMMEDADMTTSIRKMDPATRWGKRNRDQTKPEGCIREELMRSALKLFTERGYSATTVRGLVAEAGTTKPVLYYYFGSKEGLFLELMRTHFGRLEGMAEIYQKGRGSVRKRLMAMLDKGFVFVQQDLDFIRLMHAVYFGPPGEAPYFDFDAYHHRYHDLIAQFLKEGIEKGEFRPGNTGDMAWIILGTMEIAIEDQICSHASQIDRNTLRRLLNMVFDGLAANTDRGKGETV